MAVDPYGLFEREGLMKPIKNKVIHSSFVDDD